MCQAVTGYCRPCQLRSLRPSTVLVILDMRHPEKFGAWKACDLRLGYACPALEFRFGVMECCPMCEPRRWITEESMKNISPGAASPASVVEDEEDGDDGEREGEGGVAGRGEFKESEPVIQEPVIKREEGIKKGAGIKKEALKKGKPVKKKEPVIKRERSYKEPPVRNHNFAEDSRKVEASSMGKKQSADPLPESQQLSTETRRNKRVRDEVRSPVREEPSLKKTKAHADVDVVGRSDKANQEEVHLDQREMKGKGLKKRGTRRFGGYR